MLVGIGIAGVLTAGFLLGSLTLGPVFAQTQHTSPPGQTAVQSPNDDDVDKQVEEQSEAEEAAALQAKATISAADAEAAALAANSGTSAVKTELDNENGVLVYSVELSNGNDVKVDANTGKVLHTESGEIDSQGGSGEQETAQD